MLSTSSSSVKKRAEVHLLAGEIGHAAGGGFQAEHQGPLQVILGAAKFFVAHPVPLELPELSVIDSTTWRADSTLVPA